MKFSELNALSKEELKEKLSELNKQLMDLNFKRRTGVEKPHLFKNTRRLIARIHTALNQKKG